MLHENDHEETLLSIYLGWVVTYERQQSVVFGKQYYQSTGTFWATRRGNPNNFDPSNLSGARIGLVRVWNSDLPCINKLQNVQVRFRLT